MNTALESLLRHPAIHRWRRPDHPPDGRPDDRHQDGPRGRRPLPTGFPPLDEGLPEGGWPPGALTEILHEREGIGELRLVMPGLAELGRRGRRIVWINPPYVPYAPALRAHGLDLSRMLVVRNVSEADGLWAGEQALRSRACGAVLVWSSTTDNRRLRRLQLAAEAGHSWGLLFRGERVAAQPSPSALRLCLAPRPGELQVRVLKCRGRAPAAPLVVAAG